MRLASSTPRSAIGVNRVPVIFFESVGNRAILAGTTRRRRRSTTNVILRETGAIWHRPKWNRKRRAG